MTKSKAATADKKFFTNQLEHNRKELIDEAHAVAVALCEIQGQVTSTEVLKLLRHFPETERLLEEADPRFMGAVLNPSRGFREVGREKTGSHGREVRVWELDEE